MNNLANTNKNINVSRPYVELPICPECSVPLIIVSRENPHCKGCQISWEVDNEHPLPTERYFEGDDRSKAQ